MKTSLTPTPPTFFMNWSIVPIEIYNNIFEKVPTGLINAISLVGKQWYHAIREESMKARILNNLSINADPNLSLEESEKKLARLKFCIIIDFSVSMNDHNQTSVTKAIDLATKIFRYNRNADLYVLQFGNDCNYQKVTSLDETIKYFSEPKVNKNSTNFSKLYNTIEQIYNKEIMNKTALDDELNIEMEATIFSDLDATSSNNLNKLQAINIDVRYTKVGKAEPVEFWNKILNIINGKATTTKKLDAWMNPDIYEYGKAALVISNIDDQEIIRPLPRKTQNK